MLELKVGCICIALETSENNSKLLEWQQGDDSRASRAGRVGRGSDEKHKIRLAVQSRRHPLFVWVVVIVSVIPLQQMALLSGSLDQFVPSTVGLLLSLVRAPLPTGRSCGPMWKPNGQRSARGGGSEAAQCSCPLRLSDHRFGVFIRLRPSPSEPSEPSSAEGRHSAAVDGRRWVGRATEQWEGNKMETSIRLHCAASSARFVRERGQLLRSCARLSKALIGSTGSVRQIS